MNFYYHNLLVSNLCLNNLAQPYMEFAGQDISIISYKKQCIRVVLIGN